MRERPGYSYQYRYLTMIVFYWIVIKKGSVRIFVGEAF